MGSNTIIAIVVGAILVIVGFALWPVLNGASNSLYSYFQDSCDDGNGNRFLKAYVGIDNTTLGGRELGSSEYNTSERVHGGSGINIVDRSGQCAATGIQGGASTLGFATNTTGSLHTPREIYNEQGDGIGGLNRNNLNSEWRTTATGDTYSFIKVAPMLDRFSRNQQSLADSHSGCQHCWIPRHQWSQALQLRKRNVKHWIKHYRHPSSLSLASSSLWSLLAQSLDRR